MCRHRCISPTILELPFPYQALPPFSLKFCGSSTLPSAPDHVCPLHAAPGRKLVGQDFRHDHAFGRLGLDPLTTAAATTMHSAVVRRWVWGKPDGSSGVGDGLSGGLGEPETKRQKALSDMDRRTEGSQGGFLRLLHGHELYFGTGSARNKSARGRVSYSIS